MNVMAQAPMKIVESSMATETHSRRYSETASFLVGFSVIVILSLALSFFFGGWGSLISRGDTGAHLTKVRFILDNWPRFRWGDIWAAGFPMFLWYAPLPYLILAALAVPLGSIELAFSVSVIISVAVGAFGVYLIAYENDAGHLASLLAATLTVASPASWVYGLKGGEDPRLITLMFWPLSLYLAQRWVKSRYYHGLKSGRTYLAFVLTLAAVVQGHILIGSIAAITVALFLLLMVPRFGKKIQSLILVFVPALGLSAAFYVPFFLTNPTSRFLGLRVSSPPLQFQNILFDSDLPPYDGEALFPLLVPLFGALLITRLSRRRKRLPESNGSSRILLGLLLISLFATLFAFAGHFGWPSTWYINGFPPGESTIFLAVVLSAATGILMIQLGKRRRIIAATLLCLTLAISVVLYSPVNPHPWIAWSARANDPVINVTQRGTIIDPADVNYRYGTDWDRAALWFNYYYQIPQTRDYYGQGILIEDWRFWYQKAVWVDLGNYNETNYLLDWFAVRWFSVSNPHYHFEKFLSGQSQYRLINNFSDPSLAALGNPGSTFYEFEYLDATPILSATNAPALLVIGSENAYSVFFRSLAYLDFDSRHVIPVMGSAYIDDYTSSELANFEAILLYGYQYHDKTAAFTIVEKYVQDGGILIVDTGLSPQANDKDLPQVFPISSVDATNFGTSWSLSATLHPITTGVHFENFSPAVYGTVSPWGVSIASNSTVRTWAQPLVFNYGRPIAAVGQYGKGRVVWLGVNLPYHTESYKNPNETQLIVNVLRWATADEVLNKVTYSAARENAEMQNLSLNQKARGVLLKESMFENWHAYAIDGNGVKRELKIYEAGPSFMYVSLPEEMRYPAKTVFEYGVSAAEYLGYSISLVTLISLIVYASLGAKLEEALSRLVSRVRKWWHREE